MNQVSAGGDVTVLFGLGGLPSAYAGSVGRFVATYLGSPGQPRPFGGRDREMVALDAWLADPEAPRNLLLWAPAGRGKSALLVRWLARLPEEHWHTIFVPISLRFNITGEAAFHQALALRLAALLGETLTPPAGDAAAHYRDRCLDLLWRMDGLDRPVLLVVDGLDEATGWSVTGDLLPAPAPPNLRILASARLQLDDADAGGWRVRLGWDAGTARDFEVPPLDAGGVGEALRSMGAPLDGLADPESVVRELHRLTGGDPLLLGFYVEDLWSSSDDAGRLRPEDLAGREAGFAAYFRRWVERQKPGWSEGDAQSIDAVLLVLAVALGPLPHADLAGLVRRLEGERATVTGRTLRPLGRFVMGDADGGYVLCHPRLAEHLRRDHFRDPALAARADRSFVDWGLETVDALNAGALDPARTSPYLLRHLSEHLAAAGAPAAAFMRLVEDGWRRAWLAFEGGERGFAGDVRRADAAVTATQVLGQPRAAWRIRCKLVLSSINSLGRNIPSELLARAVELGSISVAQSLHLVQLKSDVDRAFALMELHRGLPEAQQTLVLAEATAVALAVDDGPSRARLLTELARILPETQRAPVLAEAFNAARANTNNESRALRLATLMPLMPEVERQLVMKEILLSVYTANNTRLPAAIAPVLPKAEQAWVLAKNLATARAIADNGIRAQTLVDLAQFLPEAQRKPVLDEALVAARANTDDGSRAQTLVDLARILPATQRELVLNEAVAAAHASDDGESRAWALIGIAQFLPETQQTPILEAALAAIRAIADSKARAQALVGINRVLPQRLLDEAFGIIRAIADGDVRTQMLASIARFLPQSLLGEALTMVRAIADGQYRARALAEMVVWLTKAERAPVLEMALAAARAIVDDGSRARSLTNLVGYQPETQRESMLAEALTATRAVEPEQERVWLLRDIALLLPEAQREPVLTEAIFAARTIAEDHLRAFTLAHLVPSMPETQRELLLNEAFATVQAIASHILRALSLVKLEHFLSPTQRIEALEEAFASACTLTGKDRIQLLRRLAPLLPKAERLLQREESLTTTCSVNNRTDRLPQPPPPLPEVQLRGSVLQFRRFESFAEKIERFDRQSRPQVLDALPALYPLLRDLEGLGGLREIHRAITDTATWYP